MVIGAERQHDQRMFSLHSFDHRIRSLDTLERSCLHCSRCYKYSDCLLKHNSPFAQFQNEDIRWKSCQVPSFSSLHYRSHQTQIPTIVHRVKILNPKILSHKESFRQSTPWSWKLGSLLLGQRRNLPESKWIDNETSWTK